jgi:hypothetical protein
VQGAESGTARLGSAVIGRRRLSRDCLTSPRTDVGFSKHVGCLVRRSAFSESSHDPSRSSLVSTHTNGDEPTSNWITKQRRPRGSIGRAGGRKWYRPSVWRGHEWRRFSDVVSGGRATSNSGATYQLPRQTTRREDQFCSTMPLTSKRVTFRSRDNPSGSIGTVAAISPPAGDHARTSASDELIAIAWLLLVSNNHIPS